MLLLSLSLPPPFISLPVQGFASTPAIGPRCVFLERLRPDTAFSSSSQILLSPNSCALQSLDDNDEVSQSVARTHLVPPMNLP
jgi:hypothetical protein